jgi:hypothetical protein
MRLPLAGLLLAGLLSPAGAQVDNSGGVVPTAVCELFPQVTCTSEDAGLNAEMVQLAADARDQLSTVMALGGTWRFPVHIVVVMPDDPKAAQVSDERVSVTAADNTMAITATLPSDDPDARAFIQRQFVTAMVWEKFFAQTKSFDANTRLDVVPTWLIEGLNEWLDRGPERDRESIVRRAALAQRAPALAEITSWQDISPDRLLGLYQRAFCYYLVNSLVQPGLKRADFQQWLDRVAKGGPTSARLLFPTEAGWQRQLLQAPERAHELVYTWAETSNALSAAETIALPGAKPADMRICTLDNVTDFTPDPKMNDALQQKIFILTALELRAHPGWRPILELYRFGLSAMAAGKLDQARSLIAQARDKRSAEVAYHQKLDDYMNWFEVTKNGGASDPRFDAYLSTAHDMERAQGDPEHPNPIRRDVLQVESQL